MFKRIILLLIIAITISFSFFSTTAPVMAAPINCDKVPASEYDKCVANPNNYTEKANTTGSIFRGNCRFNFLGFTSWDCGVNIHNEDTLKSGIWQIAANVATDISVAAAYLVIGYVIYGGYLYMFAGGEASKAATGKKTLSQAFIGLAIVMSAYAIMSTIRFALLGANGQLNCDPVTNTNCATANDIIISAISWAIGVAGIVAAIFVVYGGISYITSAGDPNKLQKAKQSIIYALIGLAIVALAEIITAFVSGMIRDANKQSQSYYRTSTIISINQSHHEGDI